MLPCFEATACSDIIYITFLDGMLHFSSIVGSLRLFFNFFKSIPYNITSRKQVFHACPPLSADTTGMPFALTLVFLVMFA